MNPKGRGDKCVFRARRFPSFFQFPGARFGSGRGGGVADESKSGEIGRLRLGRLQSAIRRTSCRDFPSPIGHLSVQHEKVQFVPQLFQIIVQLGTVVEQMRHNLDEPFGLHRTVFKVKRLRRFVQKLVFAERHEM
jgi:hypothetical protein